MSSPSLRFLDRVAPNGGASAVWPVLEPRFAPRPAPLSADAPSLEVLEDAASSAGDAPDWVDEATDAGRAVRPAAAAPTPVLERPSVQPPRVARGAPPAAVAGNPPPVQRRVIVPASSTVKAAVARPIEQALGGATSVAPPVIALHQPAPNVAAPLVGAPSGREVPLTTRASAHHTQPTIVQVTIDRIDVRASSVPAVPAPRTARKRGGSSESLGEFLRRRGGAGDHL